MLPEKEQHKVLIWKKIFEDHLFKNLSEQQAREEVENRRSAALMAKQLEIQGGLFYAHKSFLYLFYLFSEQQAAQKALEEAKLADMRQKAQGLFIW